MNKTPMVTAGQIRAALANIPDDMPIQVCINSPEYGEAAYAYTVPVCTDSSLLLHVRRFCTLEFTGESEMMKHE